MALTRMPAPYFRASSRASQMVKLSTPPLAIEYAITRLIA